MRRLLAVVLAAGMAVVPMAGCGGGSGGDGGSSCRDACEKGVTCDWYPVGLNQCIAECEDRFRVDEAATQADIDCMLEHSCAEIPSACGVGGGGGGTGQCVDIMPCPNGAGMIGFCTSATCYYTLNGQQFQCASCSNLAGCAQAVVNACGR